MLFLRRLDDLEDKFVHLANNSISKNSKNFARTYTTEDGAEHEVEGNMWHSDDFIAHLQRTHGSAAVWHEWVVPQMKRIGELSASSFEAARRCMNLHLLHASPHLSKLNR